MLDHLFKKKLVNNPIFGDLGLNLCGIFSLPIGKVIVVVQSKTRLNFVGAEADHLQPSNIV